MAKRYDPILCMLVDEPTKAQDELKIKKEDGLWCVYKDGKVVGQSNSEAGALRLYRMFESHNNAKDELLFYQLQFGSGKTEGAKLDESEIRSYAEALLERYGEKRVTVSRQGKIIATYFNRKAHDSVSALDKAIKTCDAVDVDRISNYLWLWVEGREVTSALFNEGLDKYPGPHDKEHKDEAYEFAKKYAQKELDALYSKLKSSVEKKLKEGYTNIKNAISSAK